MIIEPSKYRKDRNPIIAMGWRILLYGGIMLLLSRLLMWDAQADVAMKFSENTFTEWTQQAILIIMALIFTIAAIRNKCYRALSWLLAGASTMGLIREYNNFFNNQVFDGAWQLLAFLALLITLILFYPYRKELIANLRSFQGTLSQGFMLAGFLSTFVFSRLFGRTVFWEAIMEAGYLRSAKNAAEEGVELLGYSLLLMAGIEYFLFQRNEINPTEVKNT